METPTLDYQPSELIANPVLDSHKPCGSCGSRPTGTPLTGNTRIGGRFLCEQKGLVIPKGPKRTQEDLLHKDPGKG